MPKLNYQNIRYIFISVFIYYKYVLDILPETRLAQIFGGQTGPKVNIPKLEWMIRYISFAKYSSVFTRKGYIVCLKRSNNESTD